MRSRAAASEPDEMQIPVLLVWLVLVWSLADGAIVSKCDLREQLEKAIGNLTVTSRQKPLAGADLVAKLVCYANVANGLNTSAVTQLDGRGPNVTFYGTFQLPNDLVCSDGTVASRNLFLCRPLVPPDFVNSDIEDDALCLFRLLLLFLEHGFEADQKIQQYIQLIFNPACANALDDGYAC